ncbi:MAG: hypothetical protein ACRDHY_18280, partial [Anaerolineales bacterium]
QYTVETECHAVETILAIERRIGESLGGKLGAEHGICSDAEYQVDGADDKKYRRNDLQEGDKGGHESFLLRLPLD